MLRTYKVPENIQVDIVINGLEGEAKRLLILLEKDRSTVDQIFVTLEDLYGDKILASVLHSLCFSCRQEPQETVSEFALRLQELFKKLQNKDP